MKRYAILLTLLAIGLIGCTTDPGRGKMALGYADQHADLAVYQYQSELLCSGAKPKLSTASCVSLNTIFNQARTDEIPIREMIVNPKATIDEEKLREYGRIALKIAIEIAKMAAVAPEVPRPMGILTPLVLPPAPK